MKKSLWAGRILGAFAALFLLFDGVIHLINPAPVVEASTHLGYPTGLALELGIIELICLALYAIPRSSILGAILLTGYLGGAVASHLRVGDSLFEIVFPIIVGLMVWGGPFLRDQRVRALISPKA